MTSKRSNYSTNGPFELICEWEVKGLPTPVMLLYDRGQMVLTIWGNAWRGTGVCDDTFLYFSRGIVMRPQNLWLILYLAEARFMKYKAWRLTNGR